MYVVLSLSIEKYRIIRNFLSLNLNKILYYMAPKLVELPDYGLQCSNDESLPKVVICYRFKLCKT